MNCRNFGFAAVFFVFASTASAVPTLNVTPGGLQSGNWVWDVSITPDFVLAPSGTSLAVELGFRLIGDPLISATNINPSQWDKANPGKVIFGWETLDPSANNHPVGIQVNTSTNEIFAAYGSINFTTPGAKPFLKIVALGPDNGGPPGSTIQYLGAYPVAQTNGRIAQNCNGGPGCFGGVANYDLYAGFATQGVPEPTTAVLAGAMTVFLAMSGQRRARGPC